MGVRFAFLIGGICPQQPAAWKAMNVRELEAIHRIGPGGGLSIDPRDEASDISVEPQANPLFALTLMIVATFTAGLPMSVAINWICS
jgi:hypothetical protein